MAFELRPVGTLQVLRLSGRLDSAGSPELERSLRDALAGGRLVTGLVVDLSALDFISSAGLRVLLLAAKQLRAATPPGRLVMAGVRGNVREVFEMSGFLTLFPAADSVDDAVAQLQA